MKHKNYIHAKTKERRKKRRKKTLAGSIASASDLDRQQGLGASKALGLVSLHVGCWELDISK
jgi:hypothetical protein